jgi:putative transposase
MGKTKRHWHDTEYVLGYFGNSKGKARKEYESFVKAGLSQGRREELTGGGLIRSLGGWTEAREVLKSGVHIMSDERILGDSDFVDSIISQSDEHYERSYTLRRQGYNLDQIALRVSELLGMKPDEVFSKGRQERKVKARSLLCFWAERELGLPHTALAKKLEMSLANIGFSIERGESIAKEGNYSLEIEVI